MSIQPPQPGEYSDFNWEYIRRVPQGDVFAFMEAQTAETVKSLGSLSEEKVLARPAPGEWNIKEIIGHLCDGERVFSYRALRFARGDQTPLPGFDQDPYVANGYASQRALSDLLAEFAELRSANLRLFRSIPPEATTNVGIASDNPVSVRALIYMCAGHEHHHMESIRTVYLKMAQ